MKNLKSLFLASFLTVGIFSTTLFVSCNGDKCKDVACNNGGTCNESDGSCNCAVGFEGENCDTESRTKLFGNFILSGTDSDGDTYTNLISSIATSAVAKNKFIFNIGGVFVLTCTMTSSSSFTIDNATIAGFTYSGNGTFVGTTVSISLTETDGIDTIIYTLSGNKQ